MIRKMFDRYNIRTGGSNGPSKIDVTEHKAPTDESIRLFGEFKEKARSQIIEEIEVANNLVSGSVTLFYEAEYMRKLAYYKFSINGVEYTGKQHVGEKYSGSVSYNDRREAVGLLANAMVSEIVVGILKESPHMWEALYNGN